MLFWAVVFFLVALVSALFAFATTGATPEQVTLAQVVFIVFVVLFCAAVCGWATNRK